MGQGEVGGCTRMVQIAWPCLGSMVERSWLVLGGPFPSFWHLGLRMLLSCLVGPLFPARFSATAGCHFSGDLIAILLAN